MKREERFEKTLLREREKKIQSTLAYDYFTQNVVKISLKKVFKKEWIRIKIRIRTSRLTPTFIILIEDKMRRMHKLDKCYR